MYQKIRRYYLLKLYDDTMLMRLVEHGAISAEEYEQISGKVYGNV